MAQTFDLTGDYAIKQGATYDSLRFYYPADLSAGTARGEIRKKYLDSLGELVATFSFPAMTYSNVTVGIDPPGYYTVIQPKLTDEQTILIPVPTGSNNWYYDIFVDLPDGTARLVAEGTVLIRARVTTV